MSDFVLNQSDKDMLAKLQDFIPNKVFDFHAHIHNVEHMGGENFLTRRGTCDAQTFLDDMKLLYGDRTVNGLLIPMPTVEFKDRSTIDRVNRWILEQAEKTPQCAYEVFVKPEDTRQDIEKLLVSPQIKGLKCYHLAAQVEGRTNQADIYQYLPEAAWEVANERGLVITLHLVKDWSLADPVNLAYIQEKAAKYPNAKLILAHCGRGFASWTTIETARKLKGIDNIYYDMAAICEPATIYETIRQAGADHVMWGSDYALSRLRARPFSGGLTLHWFYHSSLPENVYVPCNLLEIEGLFAFYQASVMLELSKQEIADIFYNNAVRLLGMDG